MEGCRSWTRYDHRLAFRWALQSARQEPGPAAVSGRRQDTSLHQDPTAQGHRDKKDIPPYSASPQAVTIVPAQPRGEVKCLGDRRTFPLPIGNRPPGGSADGNHGRAGQRVGHLAQRSPHVRGSVLGRFLGNSQHVRRIGGNVEFLGLGARSWAEVAGCPVLARRPDLSSCLPDGLDRGAWIPAPAREPGRRSYRRTCRIHATAAWGTRSPQDRSGTIRWASRSS